MFILKIVRWILSYVTIIVEGGFAERFLNLAPNEGIPVWDVKRKDATRLQMCARAGDFKKLRKLARRSSCTVRIVNKTGLRFIMFRHRKRKVFAVSAVLFFLLVLFLSTLLWGVELSGADFIDNEMLIMSLSDEGLRAGVPLKELELKKIQNNILIKHEEIAWISINLKGTKAYVEVKPRTIPPEVTDKNTACNIVSLYDAVVERMEVYEGDAVVIKGEAVTRGQLLVSGVIDSETEGIRFVHSDAKIYGRVWLPVRKSIPLYETTKTYTGERMSKRAIEIAGIKINLFLDSSIPYGKYDKIINKSTLKAGPFELPATLISADISEYTESTYTIDENMARDKLKAMCDGEFKTSYPDANVELCDIKFTKTDDSYIMDAEYECIIPIVKKAEIMRNQTTEE